MSGQHFDLVGFGFSYVVRDAIHDDDLIFNLLSRFSRW